MYTRSYGDNPALTPPEGYSGTMLDTEQINEREDEAAAETSAPVSNIFSGLGGLGSLLHTRRLGDFKIGTEELLIAAVALFLLFSKNGDKECAIMLLLTLFVTK